ncbi:hypothetical protein PSA7680_02203 [Pseudoruegeria aquimaris]|uniref:DUF1330 domain-containing protein n=1 Tax=Pseudoruegeria aquimaris TaxID=393663 RepID=A0A1Y5SLQ0_9RHOB|nr:DUF1330 domain-containing protein [Pseudoruegeria aquimaris]SLN43647.1 hypothetical protein PSA7680_02203 [Pseudoruegeria aquimaris]
MIYATVHMNITDPAALAAYRERAGAALARHGGKLEAASPTPTLLDDALPAPSMVGVLSFPSREAAIAWRDDPELAEIHALRRAAGESSIILVG